MIRFFKHFWRTKKKLKNPSSVIPSSNQFSKFPHVAFFDLKGYDSRSFMTKMDYLINSFPIDEKYPVYRRTSFPVVSASPSTSRSLLLFDTDSYFYFSYYAEENNIIKVLVSRYSVLPIAVTVGKACIVLVEEEAFSPIKDHLVKKEAFDQSFLYYNMIDGFRPEEIFYSRGHVISDVDRLLKINPRNIESPDHSVIFNRILGFFLLPAILPAWLFVICSCFDQEDQWHSVRLQERTSALWQHWDGASMFVRSGGKIPMSADFGYFNLAKARVSYSILRCFEAPSTVTPALPPKLASAVPRVSFTPASRVSSPSAVPRFPPTTPVPRAPYTPTVEQSPFSTLLGGPSAIDLRGAGSTADLYFPGSQAFLKLGSDSNALLNVGFRSFSSRATVGSESHPSSPDPGGVWVAFED